MREIWGTLRHWPGIGPLSETINLGGIYHGPLRSSAIGRKSQLLSRLGYAFVRGISAPLHRKAAFHILEREQAKPVRDQCNTFRDLYGLSTPGPHLGEQPNIGRGKAGNGCVGNTTRCPSAISVAPLGVPARRAGRAVRKLSPGSTMTRKGIRQGDLSTEGRVPHGLGNPAGNHRNDSLRLVGVDAFQVARIDCSGHVIIGISVVY